MSKKFTKRALSLLIALALTISLLPSVVFATGESVVYDFNETTVTSVKNGTAAVSPSGWTLASGTNWSIDAEKTTDIKTAATYTEFITQQMYVNASDATKKYYGWLDATTDADVKKMQFAINAELSDAGWYDIEFVGCPAVQSGYTYLYFDGQYAGDYDFLDATVSPVSKAIRVSKKLNSLYLTPENGLVNIMLAKADGYYRVIDNKDVRVTNINPSQIKLTKRDEAPAVSSLNVWCNDENETPIEDAMIIRMDNAGEFAFSVKALMDNEEPLYFNGYSDDRTEVASGNPFSVIVENESVVSYSLVKNADDGIMSGKLTAINGGKTTVTIKVDVGGNAKELSFDVVVDAPIKLEFNSTTLEDTDSSKSGVQGKTLGTKDGVNYEVVTSKSTDQNVGLYSSMLRVSGYIGEEKTTGNSTVWVQHPNYETQRGMLTVKTKVPEGNYRVDFAGAPMSYGGMIYIYADGKLAGIYNCNNNDVLGYSAANTNNKVSVDYGVIEITPDADGYAEIQFCTAAASDGKDSSSTNINDGVYDGVDMLISSITLTPTTDAAPTLSSVSVKSGDTAIAENNTIDMGENLTFTAEAMMDDGKARHINGHTAAGELDQENKIEVSVDGSSVRYDVVNYYVKDADTDNKAMYDANGIYSGKITAVAPGTSTVTVTATVNGVSKSTTFTVKVPGPDTDAEDIDNTISYIVRAEDSANNSKITVSDEAYEGIGKVGEWTVGESFTATAIGSDFAYWANGSGAPVSTSASYTFNPTSNFTLEAVYAPADATTKKVQFWNYNKVFLDEVTATEETLGEKMPANPTLNGWSFTGWKTDANTTFDANTLITDAITRVVAQFTKNAAGFNVGEEIKAYDDTYTDTAADEKDGTAFSYWTIDGQVASYNKTLSFNVWDTVNVVPVYAGTKTAVPTVVLDKVSNEEYFILYEVPEGYTAVDAGIVFGNNEPRVDSTDGSKASVKKAGAKGQFTAAPHKDAAANTVARGYVMYRDTNNNLRILYTEAK